MFCELFASLPTLRSVAFPHLVNLGPYEGRRWQLAENLTRSIEKLRVPGPVYLRRNFLKVFGSLRLLFIGEKTFAGPAGYLNPIKYNYDYRGGVVKATCGGIRELGVYAKINYESGKLYHIIEKFPALFKLEIDAMRPLLDDKDVQALIKYLPALKFVSITHSDLLTDYGLTGIPKEICKKLYQLSTIYSETSLKPNNLRTVGRPLSDLKGNA